MLVVVVVVAAAASAVNAQAYGRIPYSYNHVLLLNNLCNKSPEAVSAKVDEGRSTCAKNTCPWNCIFSCHCTRIGFTTLNIFLVNTYNFYFVIGMR